MPSFAPKIRVEVYVPVRYESAYQETLSWVIEEFTELAREFYKVSLKINAE